MISFVFVKKGLGTSLKEKKVSCYILLTDQFSLSDCLSGGKG